MKKVTNKDWHTIDGRTLPINTVRDSGCYIKILEKIYSQMNAMLSYHCKVLAIRLNVHLNDHPSETNKEISTIMKRLSRKLLETKEFKSYEFKRLSYLWVREVSKDKGIHYHFVLFLDGNKIKSSLRIKEALQIIIDGMGKSIVLSVPRGTRHYMMIRRGNDNDINSAFLWFSYLAKERDKGHRPAKTNDFGATNLQAKVTTHIKS